MRKSSRGNPWHDHRGRFCSGPSGGGVTYSEKTPDGYKYQTVRRQFDAKVLVDGPSQSSKYVRDYMREHPQVRTQAKQYKSVLQNVRNFQQNHPCAEDGTYNAVTGKAVETDGYSVTFHQNHTMQDPYGAYTDKDYADLCAIAKNELQSEDVYIGYFGNAEVSFTCKSKEQAMKFAIEHNQQSIYDPYRDKTIENPFYNPKTNPTKEE